MAPILEGDQGLRKTSALAAMVPDRMFFTEIDLSKDDDTLARLLRGSLVGEISELRGLQTKDQESIKAWISRRYEKWVPKFKEFSTVFPRRCVLFGTTNRTDLLVDETGNRRWLPVHVTRADVEAIDAAREQLWAEGAALFGGLVPGWAGGVAWKEAEELAKAEHDGYRRADEWEAPVQAWLDGNDALEDTGGTSAGRARGESPFTVLDVLCGALGMSVKEVDSKAQLRCGAVLRSLGYAKHNLRVGGAQAKRWAKV
jgi:predicted P-loop ATPase